MQSKSIATIVVLSLLVASLSVSGCTNTENAETNPISSTVPDSQLAEYVNAYHQTLKELYPSNLSAFNVTWINNTTAEYKQRSLITQGTLTQTQRVVITAKTIRSSNLALLTKQLNTFIATLLTIG